MKYLIDHYYEWCRSDGRCCSKHLNFELIHEFALCCESWFDSHVGSWFDPWLKFHVDSRKEFGFCLQMEFRWLSHHRNSRSALLVRYQCCRLGH